VHHAHRRPAALCAPRGHLFAPACPKNELVINDDGAHSVADLVPGDLRIRYFAPQERAGRLGGV